jgi:GNAT superfamily N-acetyltransferase
MTSVTSQAQIPSKRGLIAMRADHLPQAVSLSAALGWPYREEDWRFAFELGRGVAVEADDGLAATALWWPYEPAFASFGMIIVSPALQGRGMGRMLMDELLRQAEGRTIILNSTREGYRLYERLGFVPCGQVNQHQAVLVTAPPEPRANGPIRPLRSEDIGAIRDLDYRASGMGRTQLLDALFTVGNVVVIERERRVQGYACVRRWGRGVVIGPVIARDAMDAKALITMLAAEHRGGFVRIDVPATSGLSPWLEQIGLPHVDQVVSMVRGQAPTRAADATLFALSNQSLG